MASKFQSALTRAKAKRKAPVAPALPPLGSFDPSILLQYGQNKRTAEQAQQTYDLGQAQAQDDFGIQKGRIAQSEQNALSDLGTTHDRTIANIGRNYAVLADTQAEQAGRAHVESGGILAQALARRQANQAAETDPVNQDYATNVGRTQTAAQNQQADLALALARAYGSGKNGQPLGSNTLGLTQSKSNALGSNLDLSGVAFQQAAALGYRTPTNRKRRTTIV